MERKISADHIRIEPDDQSPSAEFGETFDLPERLGEIERKLKKQPAKVYDLAALSSLLARCNVKNLTQETAEQLADVYGVVMGILESSVKPDVAHNDPVLVQKSLSFLDRITRLGESDGVRAVFSDRERERIRKIIDRIRLRCRNILQGADKKEFFVTGEEIETSFGLTIFSDIELAQAKDELDRWSETKHPAIPPDLRSKVNAEQTAKLIEYFKAEVFGVEPAFPIDVYTGGDPRNHHLFWSLKSDTVDYFTPESYDLATQLSFDIPHNVAHLAHLEAIRKKGATGFIDLMEERAFFEGVAVLAESLMIDVVKDDKQAQTIQRIIVPSGTLTPEALAEWIIQDRSYEFRLRAVRLLGDALTIKGGTFPEVADQVSRVVHLPHDEARAEIAKYYEFTGLGAVYTLGYRKFWNKNVFNPGQAITQNRKPVTTWSAFDAETGT